QHVGPLEEEPLTKRMAKVVEAELSAEGFLLPEEPPIDRVLVPGSPGGVPEERACRVSPLQTLRDLPGDIREVDDAVLFLTLRFLDEERPELVRLIYVTGLDPE